MSALTLPCVPAPPSADRRRRLRNAQRQTVPLVLMACYFARDISLFELAYFAGYRSSRLIAGALGGENRNGLRLWLSKDTDGRTTVCACQENVALALRCLFRDLDPAEQLTRVAEIVREEEANVLAAFAKLPVVSAACETIEGDA